MARSNGPFGPGGTRAPARRLPTDDPFAPPAGQGGGHNAGWPPAPYPDQGGQQGQGYHFPPEQDQNAYGQHQGYGQAPAQQYEGYANGMEQPSYPQQQWSQHPDPRGYDLGNYMPASQPYAPADPGPFRQGADRAYGGSHQGYADSDADYADDDFADMDEPRRGRRWMFVAAAALIGAVGVGGALAYTYKSLFAPSAGRVPVVKAEQGNRAKPSDKSLTRVNDEASKQAPGSDQQDDRVGDDGGPRRVKTIAINPGAPGMVPAAQGEVSPSVPGIMLDVRPRAPQAAPPKGAQPSAPQSPRVSIGVPPANLVQQQQPEADASPPKRAAVAVAQPPPAAKPPARPASPTPAAAAPSTGSGYVAVLSSQKSRLDALKVFADLQQKYPDALANKVPDVQEKDLSERGLGTMFRLVVGPPGSRQAASGVCGQLKSAGHEGCWVTEY